MPARTPRAHLLPSLLYTQMGAFGRGPSITGSSLSTSKLTSAGGVPESGLSSSWGCLRPALPWPCACSPLYPLSGLQVPGQYNPAVCSLHSQGVCSMNTPTSPRPDGAGQSPRRPSFSFH